MHTISFIFIISCALTLNGGYGSEVNIPPPASTILPANTTSTPLTTISTTTTPKPLTTNSTTTTPKPLTTNSTTTTPKPTTTKFTTTTKPLTTNSTTTTTPTPITPAPTRPPRNLYTVMNQTYYCLIMNVSIEIEVANATEVVPASFSVIGHCNKNVSSLEIYWFNNYITFNFDKTDGKYEISSITLSFKNATYQYEKIAFPVSLSESYKCDKVQNFELTKSVDNQAEEKNNEKAHIYISQLQYQAFMNTNETVFSKAWDCNTANTTDVVPIVVGCILAVLVILILVAYLFGRRRCQAHGYLSMFSKEGNDRDYIPMKTLSCFK
ncbi:hypothetical protein GWI33_002457 [Rhynchophorus ferrugineus]|uniref:Lysosome-associated membrane glycoprotein 2-like transmembrane domain-containing protein n=1 Tax=Rhynchophorus ferrugineus TaxID=354439 RepID=A0A834IVK2_RHYFE|nr:hypothetical protein GWI33_002457 [Rhynchophorus ferrugineus]